MADAPCDTNSGLQVRTFPSADAQLNACHLSTSPCPLGAIFRTNPNLAAVQVAW
jgi:hypothetical protein